MLTDRSRQRVRREIARLDDQFSVERVVEDEWRVSPERYERTVERFEAGTLGGAGAWVARENGAVLLVRREGYDAWQEPSGKHEPDETLAETARRETREETGVKCELRTVELAQQLEIVDDTDPDRPALVRLVVVFGAAYAGGTPCPRPGEIAAVDWFDKHPDVLLYQALAKLPVPAPWGRT